MSKHDPLASQLDEIISASLAPLEHVDIIDVGMVADDVDRRIDPGQASPALKSYCSRMQIRARVRQILARRYDPKQKAEEYIEGERDDLFDGLLQDRYPVRRCGDRGYARRDVMTAFDVEFNASRMRKAGNALVQHADALEAWNKSRAASE
jgi:N-acetyl-anhydromuramyl-L-alanine amidase AmpD